MPTTPTTIDIIIPAYNEALRIGATLDSYASFFAEWSQRTQHTVTLTVVVNGTTDNTEAVVRSHAESSATPIHILVIPEKIGKGGAVYAGWKQSPANIVGFVDADGATSAKEYGNLIEHVLRHDDVDGVIGSRFIGGATVVNRTSPLRTLMSHTFITIIQWLFWLPYRDTQCGAKVFRRNIVHEVLPQLCETGMQFDVELLWRIHRNGRRIVELPTVWVDQPGSAQLASKWDFITTGTSMVWKLIMLRLRG